MNVNVERSTPVPPPPPPPQKVEKVVLTLTEGEAVFLAALAGQLRATGTAFYFYKTLSAEGLGYGHPDYDDLAAYARRAYSLY